jgi:hypothetical protein
MLGGFRLAAPAGHLSAFGEFVPCFGLPSVVAIAHGLIQPELGAFSASNLII